MDAGFKNIVELGTSIFELAGVAVIFIGFLIALWQAGRATFVRHDPRAGYDVMRSVFGRTVLLGLEVLVAADIIRTVAVDPTPTNMAVLGLLVLIRTFLSWSLDVELDGMFPWRRWQLTHDADAPSPAVAAAETADPDEAV